MKYILIGLLISIGWHLVKLAYELIAEIIFVRLHEAKWYNIVAGKQKRNKSKKSGDISNRIGF